jgi:hypothetical protein
MRAMPNGLARFGTIRQQPLNIVCTFFSFHSWKMGVFRAFYAILEKVPVDNSKISGNFH